MKGLNDEKVNLLPPSPLRASHQFDYEPHGYGDIFREGQRARFDYDDPKANSTLQGFYSRAHVWLDCVA
eukprot:g16505.t1